MNKDTCSIPVFLDAAAFRKFAMFDALTLHRRWISPAIFTLILAGSAAVCFAMHSRASGAIVLGSVLLAVAFGLPAVYFYTFLSSIRQQTAKLGLSGPRHVYTVTLTGEPDGIQFRPIGPAASGQRFLWDAAPGAYRTADAIYLYAAPGRAFLFPDSIKRPSQDDLWAYLQKHLNADQLHDRRRTRKDI